MAASIAVNFWNLPIDILVKSRNMRWLSKNRQRQGAQILRDEAYFLYAAQTTYNDEGCSSTQQLATFCDAITIDSAW